MIISFMILVAFTPVFLWVKYLHERTGTVTPVAHLCPAFCAGLAITYPALIIQNFLIALPDSSFSWLYDLALVRAVTQDGAHTQHFLRAFVLGGFVEEFLKLLAVLGVLLAVRRTVRPVSLILIAVAVAGAFAAVENLLFSLNAANWGRVATLRALISLPHHVFLGVIMGFFIGCAWKSHRWRYALSCLAFAVPALLHGIANFALAVGTPDLAAPSLIQTLARQFHGFILIAEALFAIMIIARVSWLRSGDAEAAAAKQAVMGRRYLSLRRAFWGQVAVIIGVFGVINLLTIASSPAAFIPSLGSSSTFIIGAMSLLYAVAIWGHARTPAVAPA